ncbi:arginase family protein [Helicobacter pullorum]|uniref:arginase family protein n=1 Tax=Helicobacter pullorum TaxID=35818 RepID=UPI001D795CB6|nr:arginase family protein [Helicobacter pullorum]HJF83915.1 arginase family protein [Helicobacter pullorum]
MNTLRLLYPQWQGGDIARLVPELSKKDSSLGYYLGVELLEFLAPKSLTSKTAKVPISLEYSRESKNGILNYDEIVAQSKAALEILNTHKPDKILTLGGECSVSIVPFSYLANKYKDDVAIVWIDAHKDLNLQGDSYEGYHAMALAACFGLIDKEGIARILPAHFSPKDSILVGVRDFEGKKERCEEIGVQVLSPEEARDFKKLLEWLKSRGKSKVVVHFDLDVLDPSELIMAVGVVENGLKIAEVVNLINAINTNYDLVGLSIAEHMPRVAIKLRNMMRELPLFE